MPELRGVLIALSTLVVLEGFSIVQQAVMERQLDFKKLALRANMAVLLGGAVGIPLALWGAGVWALVAQQIVGDVTLLAFLWAMSTWRPRLRFCAGTLATCSASRSTCSPPTSRGSSTGGRTRC